MNGKFGINERNQLTGEWETLEKQIKGKLADKNEKKIFDTFRVVIFFLCERGRPMDLKMAVSGLSNCLKN
jgi:hypothetical protein